MSAPIIFSGPSLRPQDRACASIDFRPPAAQGDIFRAISDAPAAIGLIDGFFGDRLAVHQKEILEAMEAGIAVYGAASMGALRAVELAPFGMVGLGKVFQDYASGALSSDADVAVGHAPEALGFLATSVSLVDVKATLNHPVVRASFRSQLRRDILKSAQNIHFLERNWPRIVKETSSARDDMLDILENNQVAQKRADARALVRLFEQGAFSPMIGAVKTPITLAYSKMRMCALRNGLQT